MNVYKLYFMRMRILVAERIYFKIQILSHKIKFFPLFTWISPARCLFSCSLCFTVLTWKMFCMPIGWKYGKKNCYLDICCFQCMCSVLLSIWRFNAHTIIKTSIQKQIRTNDFQYIFELHLSNGIIVNVLLP